jgi:hypothetical protein
VSWTSALDTVYTLGYPNDGVSTLVDCHMACVNELSCVGVDWNPEGKLGRTVCGISLPSSQRESAAVLGITHFTITRSTDCQVGKFAKQSVAKCAPATAQRSGQLSEGYARA